MLRHNPRVVLDTNSYIFNILVFNLMPNLLRVPSVTCFAKLYLSQMVAENTQGSALYVKFVRYRKGELL